MINMDIEMLNHAMVAFDKHDLDDIIYFQTKWGKRIRRNPAEALRLLYVAMSRATKHAYLKL